MGRTWHFFPRTDWQVGDQPLKEHIWHSSDIGQNWVTVGFLHHPMTSTCFPHITSCLDNGVSLGKGPLSPSQCPMPCRTGSEHACLVSAAVDTYRDVNNSSPFDFEIIDVIHCHHGRRCAVVQGVSFRITVGALCLSL